jgi:hypothetical protein
MCLGGFQIENDCVGGGGSVPLAYLILLIKLDHKGAADGDLLKLGNLFRAKAPARL